MYKGRIQSQEGRFVTLVDSSALRKSARKWRFARIALLGHGKSIRTVYGACWHTEGVIVITPAVPTQQRSRTA